MPHALAALEGRSGSTQGAAAFLMFAEAYRPTTQWTETFFMRAMEVGGENAAHLCVRQQDQQQHEEQQQQLPFMWSGTAGRTVVPSRQLVWWAYHPARHSCASTVVNGWASQPRTWGAGVRQGCPLTPAIYLSLLGPCSAGSGPAQR